MINPNKVFPKLLFYGYIILRSILLDWRKIMDYFNQILEEIELKRKEMLEHARAFGLNSPFTVKSSQELDTLLNTYQQIKNDTQNKIIC